MDASSRSSAIPGVILILLGVLFLLPSVTDLHMRELWPVFVMGPGIVFLVMGFANRAHYGLLMPGTLMTLFGVLFFYCAFEGWYHMRTLWPVFIIGPGIGFLMMYLFGRKEVGLLVTGAIMAGIGFFFLGRFWGYGYFWPIVLIALGLILLINSMRKQQP